MFYYLRFWIVLAVILIIFMFLTACGGGSDVYEESYPSFNGPPNIPTFRSPIVVYNSSIYYQ